MLYIFKDILTTSFQSRRVTAWQKHRCYCCFRSWSPSQCHYHQLFFSQFLYAQQV